MLSKIRGVGINRYMLGCKLRSIYGTLNGACGINRYMLGCKLTNFKITAEQAKTGINRYMLGCK